MQQRARMEIKFDVVQVLSASAGTCSYPTEELEIHGTLGEANMAAYLSKE
jgi:hypothetical protein